MAPFEMLAMMAAANGEDGDEPKGTLEGRVADLVARARAYAEPRRQFKVGDIVRQRDGLMGLTAPTSDNPAIVLRFVDPPERSNAADGGQFDTMNDLVIGVISPRGAFLTYGFDSRRLEIHTEAEAVRPKD